MAKEDEDEERVVKAFADCEVKAARYIETSKILPLLLRLYLVFIVFYFNFNVDGIYCDVDVDN